MLDSQIHVTFGEPDMHLLTYLKSPRNIDYSYIFCVARLIKLNELFDKLNVSLTDHIT